MTCTWQEAQAHTQHFLYPLNFSPVVTELIYILAMVNMKNYISTWDYKYYSWKIELLKVAHRLMLHIDRHLRAPKNLFYERMINLPNNNFFISVFILIRMYCINSPTLRNPDCIRPPMEQFREETHSSASELILKTSLPNRFISEIIILPEHEISRIQVTIFPKDPMWKVGVSTKGLFLTKQAKYWWSSNQQRRNPKLCWAKCMYLLGMSAQPAYKQITQIFN